MVKYIVDLTGLKLFMEAQKENKKNIRERIKKLTFRKLYA